MISYQKSAYSHYQEDLKQTHILSLDTTERKALVFTHSGEFRYLDIDFKTGLMS